MFFRPFLRRGEPKADFVLVFLEQLELVVVIVVAVGVVYLSNL